MTSFTEWTAVDAAAMIAVPRESDDKYLRGVLGVITGSEIYPGAAVLGVEAALRTGVGMVRYLGPERPTSLVLERRPETVTLDGRVQAWLLGSGMDFADLEPVSSAWMASAMEQGLPTVLDGGGLEFCEKAIGPIVLTPHYGELARILAADRHEIAGDPQLWAELAAERLNATVLLKGHSTFIAGAGVTFVTKSAPTWLATAGAGDALAGILGALLATHATAIAEDAELLPRLAATAAVIHGLAATRASAGGPLTVLDLAAAIPATIAELIGAEPA
jgi:ADP-dependent NAD(P)H-hydrate dehydratase / NAD(P)H-hydrate epimerase